jgi:hypothetical protein
VRHSHINWSATALTTSDNHTISQTMSAWNEMMMQKEHQSALDGKNVSVLVVIRAPAHEEEKQSGRRYRDGDEVQLYLRKAVTN